MKVGRKRGLDSCIRNIKKMAQEDPDRHRAAIIASAGLWNTDDILLAVERIKETKDTEAADIFNAAKMSGIEEIKIDLFYWERRCGEDEGTANKRISNTVVQGIMEV